MQLAPTLGPGSHWTQHCQRLLASTYLFETGRLDDARAMFERLLEDAETAGDADEAMRCAFALGITAIAQDDRDLAWTHVRRAAAIVEARRAEVTTPENQRRISKTNAPLYMILVRLALERGDMEFAFEAVEMNRARAIQNQLGLAGAWQRRAPDEADLTRYEEVVRREAECFAELQAAAQAPGPLRDRWHGAMKTRRKLLHEMEERVAASGLRQAAREDRVLPLLSAALPPDSAAVLYHRGDRVGAFVVTRETISHASSDVESATVSRAAAELRRRIAGVAGVAGRPAVDRELRELDTDLHRALVAPLEPHVTGRARVYLVPTEDLSHGRLDADLRVLSACHSGRGTSYAGDEFVGFPSAFLAAGARAVLGSLWSIDDASARAFLDAFYHAYEGGAAGPAFRAATRSLAGDRDHDHPCFWGAFQLFGALGPA